MKIDIIGSISDAIGDIISFIFSLILVGGFIFGFIMVGYWMGLDAGRRQVVLGEVSCQKVTQYNVRCEYINTETK
jgi:hypothetical protein